MFVKGLPAFGKTAVACQIFRGSLVVRTNPCGDRSSSPTVKHFFAPSRYKVGRRDKMTEG